MCTASEFVKRFKEGWIEERTAKISKRPAVTAANNGLAFSSAAYCTTRMRCVDFISTAGMFIYFVRLPLGKSVLRSRMGMGTSAMMMPTSPKLAD